MGGVLLTNGWDTAIRKRTAEHFELKFEEIDPLHSFIFNVYEIGKITLDQYLDFVVFNQPRKFKHQEFKDYMFAQSGELPGTLQWLIEWKQKTRRRIISINNEGKELNDYRVAKFKLRDCFDAFVSSCDVGLRKPDPDIFRLALGVAQVKADDCIYIDDRPMVVAAAARLGIHAVQHKGFDDTKSILENL